MKMFPSIISIVFALIPSSGFAQHILACRGTDQLLIGSSSLFQMQEGETYPVIGVSVNGNLMFNTPFGGADYHGDRVRVLNGGHLTSENQKACAGFAGAPLVRRHGRVITGTRGANQSVRRAVEVILCGVRNLDRFALE